MKRTWLRVGAVLIGLGILSGLSAAVTIHYLYQPQPERSPVPSAIAAVQNPVAAEPSDSLTEAAIALVQDLPNLSELIDNSLLQMVPQPLRASLLPGNNSVLVWTSYTRPDGTQGTGPLLLRYQEGRPTAVLGPLVPPGGYTRPALTLLDERSRRLPVTDFEGKPLLLIAPRRPAAGLGYTLASLHEALTPHGVTVALVIDVGAPDWISTARREGFTGPVWRLKGQLDRIPVVTPGMLDGAVGVMIDREGYAVGSLPLLEPSAYDLFDREPAQIAVQVLQAYGLIP